MRMEPELPASPDPSRGLSALPLELRAARRLTITVPFGLMKRLKGLADRRGRSTSNCAAWLLEQALRELGAGDQDPAGL